MSKHARRTLLLFLSVFAVTFGARAHAQYHPKHKEVKAIIKKAADYLDNGKYTESKVGGQALVALALLKADAPTTNAKIQRAVELCTQDIDRAFRTKETVVYELCTAIIFLSELDAEQYKPQIKTMMDRLVSWQKSFGGWGYLEGLNKDNGDTSQTQYAVLATWTAERLGAYPMNKESVINVCNWLLRTQDPSGAWGYQGKDPGSFDRVGQEAIRESLGAAGSGSLYICADLLRLTKGSQSRLREQSNVPSALRVVKTETPSQLGPLTNEINESVLRQSMSDATKWVNSHLSFPPKQYPMYYLYSLERYETFRKLASGEKMSDTDSPEWYNRGVRYLMNTQLEDGRWEQGIDSHFDASFAILFLVRGTLKSVQKAQGFGGRMRGGRGLPTDTADVTIGNDGTIQKTPFQNNAEVLLKMLEGADFEEFDALSQDIEITLSDDPKKRAEELIRLRRLVGAEEFSVRFAAVKALAKTGELDNVPVFIFALGDPDRRVVVEGRNALRSLSRKFNGFGLSDRPSDGEKLGAIQRWKEWYKTIRPDVQFLN